MLVVLIIKRPSGLVEDLGEVFVEEVVVPLLNVPVKAVHLSLPGEDSLEPMGEL
jgi:hypothetical protein